MNALSKADIKIYADGSATDAEHCGSGVLIIEEHTQERHSISLPAGRYGSSFRAAAVAIHTAMKWLRDSESQGTFNILTDSLSVRKDLSSGPGHVRSTLQDDIWDALKQLSQTQGN